MGLALAGFVLLLRPARQAVERAIICRNPAFMPLVAVFAGAARSPMDQLFDRGGFVVL
jgi:hypothetical protein